MHKTNTRIAVAEALVSVEFVTAIHGFRVKSTSGASIANVTTTRVLLPTNRCVLDQIMENVTAVSVSVDLDGRYSVFNADYITQYAFDIGVRYPIKGESCECATDESKCIQPNGDGSVCSGKGVCKCGGCQCQEEADGLHSGAFCEVCPVSHNLLL